MALGETGADGEHVFSHFMEQPAPFTLQEISESSLRDFLRAVDLTLVPDLAEEKIDDAIASTLMKNPSLRNLFAFVERGGWYSAEGFVVWLKRRLDTSGPMVQHALIVK